MQRSNSKQGTGKAPLRQLPDPFRIRPYSLYPLYTPDSVRFLLHAPTPPPPTTPPDPIPSPSPHPPVFRVRVRVRFFRFFRVFCFFSTT